MKLILIILYVFIPYLPRALEAMYQNDFTFTCITKFKNLHIIKPHYTSKFLFPIKFVYRDFPNRQTTICRLVFNENILETIFQISFLLLFQFKHSQFIRFFISFTTVSTTCFRLFIEQAAFDKQQQECNGYRIWFFRHSQKQNRDNTDSYR